MSDELKIDPSKRAIGRDVQVIDAFGYSYANEQAFKRAWMRHIECQFPCDVFEIENEEKEPGFPDLLCVTHGGGYAQFFEIKVARKGGIFKFEPTQPLFYRQHPFMRIMVVVWDAEQKQIYTFGSQVAARAALEKGRATPKGIYLNVREI
jgi:hypothetical protein